MVAIPPFYIVPGSAVKDAIARKRSAVFEAVEQAYRLYAAKDAINPDSYFLRFPDRPNARIIALPAHLGGSIQKSGIKWISSFPDNRQSNLARASAVQILNDAVTGYPIACLEASLISATRTAVSAALAAERLTPNPYEGTLGIVGTGVIARETVRWLLYRKWKFQKVLLFDLDPRESQQFRAWLADEHGVASEVVSALESAVRANLIIFTTTTGEPYLSDVGLFSHKPTVLHLSLRDIDVPVILASQNIVDDVDHCLKARTSLHLCEIATGSRDFVHGTLVDVLDRRVRLDNDRPRIFSPFGMGILDIAVSDIVLSTAVAEGSALALPSFFSNSERW
ncbi:MAG: 2,3-diaminopropionate biosynthesis protein SbnB [Hyphomicrobiaceae bacterium]